jgi:hypothetical protein
MDKFGVSLGLAIAATIMLIVPIGLSGDAKASNCSFSTSTRHFSQQDSTTSSGSCSAGGAISQSLGTSSTVGGFKSTCINVAAGQNSGGGQVGLSDSGGVSCPHP